MTFMRKIMDALNMDNWKENCACYDSSRENTTNLSRKKNTSFLQNIRHFWESYPQNYQNYDKYATQDEYQIYGKTLMLWGFTNASSLRTSFPVYFERECHISNPQKLQYQLLCESYIEPAPLSAILNSYKMQDLKMIADSLGCKKNGKKAELIDRIIHNLDESMRNSIISSSDLFILSDKGRNFLNSNYDYVELHRHWDYRVSLYDFNRNRIPDGIRKRTFEDNIYTLVSQRIYQNCLYRNYYMMEYDYNILYSIALSEHLYDVAINNYLRSLYLRSCCLQTAQYYATDFPHSAFNEESETIFTVHSAPPIARLGKFYNSSFVEIIYEDKSLPPSFLTKDEALNMVDSMVNCIVFDYRKYNELIISRLREYSKL